MIFIAGQLCITDCLPRFQVSPMFPASRGLFCLVFGVRQEKRSPKTRDNCRPLLFPVEVENSEGSSGVIDVGNSMICSDIWHKYHE